MQTFWSLFDRVLNLLALIAAAILPFVFAAIIYDVTTRTLRVFQINWVVAITEYALLYVAALGTPWLLREKGHVSMEAFRAVLPEAVNRVIEKIVIVLCTAACLVVAWVAVPVMIQNIGVTDIRANFLTRWLLYAPIVLCFALCAVQFARFLITGTSLYRGIDADAGNL
ncbi:TRAP-type C4-dicarboxylate transport system, small permease component [Roseivivax lentus]|uniref:TRAP transporter small permease protein n=1 Tax=Roseivivax lentus TaxID=633194 RepID=A0A1N7LNK8_9RHOB|nr:TRAP transporter small permease [Roseivivax lentus]SIS75407.1 TRAP-type C4-dicarboxylate transport system, small permease component [Roseivivax lentus]